MTAPRFLLAPILAATLLTLPVFATEDPCGSALAGSLIYRSSPTLEQLKKLGVDSKREFIQAIAARFPNG